MYPTSAAKNQPISPNPVPETAEKFIDRLFENLVASCPQLLNRPQLLNLTGHQIETAKQQWILGFAENGITRFEQIKRGMAAMRAKPNGWLPSVGEFIALCREQDYHALGLPTPEELEPRLKKFFGYAKFDAHKFDYRSPQEYHLLRTLYYGYAKKNWDDCLKAMPKVLADTVDKVRQGYAFDPIPELIEEKPKIIDPQVAREGIAMCQAILRGH